MFKRICQNCKKDFAAKTERRVYCSSECKWQGWYQKNKGKRKESSRLWYRRNKEKVKRSSKIWWDRKGKYLEKRHTYPQKGSKEWFLYRQKRQVIDQNRIAKIKDIGGRFSLREWQKLKEQFSYTCPTCGRREPQIHLTIDHITPISKGGNNWIENIQPLCKICNLRKGAKLLLGEGGR